MTRSRISLALFCVALLLVMGIAANAGAANATVTAKPPVATAPKAAPYVTGRTEVQIWPQADSNIPTQAVVITDVTLPSNTKLPAVVRIPIVPGTTVMWAGESLDGAAPDSDPQRQIKEVTGAGGAKYAEFVLSKSLRGQTDAIGLPLKFSGDEVSFSTEWVQSTETSSVLFTVRFPAGSSRIKIDPKPQGEPQTNMSGESLYALPEMKLAPGAKQAIKVSYSTNPSGEKAMSSSSKTAIYVVLGVLLVAAVALLALLFVRGSGRGPDQPNDAQDDETNDGGPEAPPEQPESEQPTSLDDDPFDDLDVDNVSEGRD